MEFFDELMKTLDAGKHNVVIDKITSFLNENPEYKTIDYYHFANPIEEILYNEYLGEFDSIKKIDKPLEDLYIIYAMAYIKSNDLENGEKYLKIANKINPVSARILMNLSNLYQQKNEEEKLKELAMDIMKYTYEVDLLKSSYFKLADYYYHTNQEPELYNHLLSFYMQIATGEIGNISEDIKYLKNHSIQIGFNSEIIKILMYLIDVFTQQGMKNVVNYFKNILNEIIEFNKYLQSLE